MTANTTQTSAAGVSNSLWHVYGHSQIGSAHVRLGTINQDHVDWHADQQGQRFAAAVADGHGAAPHFRSDIGARLAVQSALECLQRRLAQGSDDGSINSATGATGVAIGAEIESRWNELVQAHLSLHPYAANEYGGHQQAAHQQAADEELTGNRPYGSTLLAVAASPRWLVTAQIGDGDCCIGYVGQALLRVDASQDRFQGEQTLSLCLENAAQYFTIHVIDLDWASSQPDFVVLSTDGVAKSFPSTAAYERAIAQFRDLCMSPLNRFDEVTKQIPAWLNEVSQRGSGDDATLLLAMRKLQSDVW
jgi:serine/threonine protein phosphatase PrpC